ncbi:uncharacterized protein LOC123450270 [Hordeum vulgare subsp. vulgare]|uniref:uncharacterized protein LOC123450270 n=1 Tax=Hordeum vulgare subsp. vulgare TaxID=112509 RepID=UPI001D1A4487|nr:uncharacterized protein LOC123450270 [Hordeum vulgare subsp. vulgare]
MAALHDRIATIVGGDQAKIARLREILSWFDNDWEVSVSMKEMVGYLRDSERDEIHSRDGVPRESVKSIEYLLTAMEQTDSEERRVRCRWWVYRSRIEHLEDDPTITCAVPFVRVLFQVVPPKWTRIIRNKRPFPRATTLAHHSPRFPRRSLRLNGGGGVQV